MLEHHTVDVHAVRPVLVAAGEEGNRFAAALGIWVSPGGPLEHLVAADSLPLADLDAAPSGGQPGVTLRLRNERVALALRLPLSAVLLAAAGQVLDPVGTPTLLLAISDGPAPEGPDEVILRQGETHLLPIPVVAVRDAAADLLTAEHLRLLDRVADLASAPGQDGSGLVATVVADTIIARTFGTHPDALHALLSSLPPQPDLAADFLEAAGRALAAAVRDLSYEDLVEAGPLVQQEIPGAGLLLQLAYSDVLCAGPDEDVDEVDLPTAALETVADVADDWAPQRWRMLTGRGIDEPALRDVVEVTVELLAWLTEQQLEDPSQANPQEVAELLAWEDGGVEDSFSTLMLSLDATVREVIGQCWAIAACYALEDPDTATQLAQSSPDLAQMPAMGALNAAFRFLQEVAGILPPAAADTLLTEAARDASSPAAEALLTALASPDPEALPEQLALGQAAVGPDILAPLGQVTAAADHLLEVLTAAGTLARVWHAHEAPGGFTGPVTLLTEALEDLPTALVQVPTVLSLNADLGSRMLRQVTLAAVPDQQENVRVGAMLVGAVRAAEPPPGGDVDRLTALEQHGVTPEVAHAVMSTLTASSLAPRPAPILDALAALLASEAVRLAAAAHDAGDGTADAGHELATLLNAAVDDLFDE